MNIVAINISASIMILLTILMRKAAKKFVHNSVFCLLWLIIAMRLILPLSLETPFSFFNPCIKAKNEFSYLQRIHELTAYHNIAENINVAQNIVEKNVHFIFILWLIGFCMVAVYFILDYTKVRKYVRDAKPLKDEAWIQEEIKELHFMRRISLKEKDHLNTPVTWGIFNPTIFFPKGYDFHEREKVRFVLYHECGHIKYFHFIIKLLHILLVCLYWYNPFVWIMHIYQEYDLEITSDRFALSKLKYDCRKAYADYLIDMAGRQKKESMNILHFYKKNQKYFLKERVNEIMGFKKMTAGAVIMTMLIPLGMTTAFATTNTVLDVEKTNVIVEKDTSVLQIDIDSEVEIEAVEVMEPISISVDWSELQPYVKPSVERAASYYEVEYYEYVTYGKVPPATLAVKAEIDGYTYKGTLNRVDYVYQNALDKYTGFYSGKIYRQ